MRTTTQAVTGALRAAGFRAAGWSRRTGQTRGYQVVQGDRRLAVTVWSDYSPEGEDPMAYSVRVSSALVRAGFTVDRPFPDATILRTRRA